MAADRDHLNRQLRTLQHCALYRRTIRFACRRCAHERMLDAVPLWWLFERKRWTDNLPEVPPHFYCAACHRDRSVIGRPRLAITEADPVGPQFDYPPERIWKRLVSRYRS